MTEPPATVGRYHVGRLIAHGGMGSVYLARDPAIDRPVVIKLLKEGFDDATARDRFAREARAAGRLHHPNIVTVFDVGEHENRPFIAMEYVSGETLAQLIGRRAVGRVWEKLGILEELCAGLHYAHCAAIVHRDIKPANVMRDESGLVKILDFGIARGGGEGLTRVGDIVGTLNYMSPEQLVGKSVDHRADIYSVGALAYELITNQMAFPGTIETGVLYTILDSGPVPIASLIPGIDPDITAMVERAMAREPHARYRDLETLRQDLAVTRTRLLETASDLEEATDPNAETRLSARIGSGTQPRPSSRAGSTPHRTAKALAARPASQVIPPPRRTRLMVFLGVACAALATALAATLMLNRLSVTSPPARTDTARQQAEPPAPSTAAPPRASADQPEDLNRTQHEIEVSAARVAARQQIVVGQRQLALDTLIRGLALDDKDSELNALVDELAEAARRTATEARAAADVRGANPKSSAAFREGQAREREAGRLLRAGDRVPAVQVAWAAAALYNRAPEGTATNASRPAPSAQPTNDPVGPPSPTPGNKPVLTAPSPESLKTLPGAVAKPSPLSPPPAPKSEPPPVSRDPAPDPRAADLSEIRETLRRYTQAYQSLDGAAVGRMMPSLTAEQLRDLGRDFANYRSYTRR
ncbi:MAG: serine/threonine protein kinase [Acidobacteria bacterium]|nr:serine/threonine protein kinase [Acidobacteriota bacterium]